MQLIGAPAEAPAGELIQRVSRACAQHSEIMEAYLFQTLFLAHGEDPRLCLGLLFDPRPEDARLEEIAQDLGDHCRDVLPPNGLTFQVLEQ